MLYKNQSKAIWVVVSTYIASPADQYRFDFMTDRATP